MFCPLLKKWRLSRGGGRAGTSFRSAEEVELILQQTLHTIPLHTKDRAMSRLNGICDHAKLIMTTFHRCLVEPWLGPCKDEGV